MTRTMVIATLALFCASCATGGNNSPDYGTYPNNYEQLVKDYLDRNLKDPDSLTRLKIDSPVAGRYWAGLLYGGNYIYGYRSCVSYNAKNSYGGYTGVKTYVYWLKNGRVDRTFPNAGYCPS